MCTWDLMGGAPVCGVFLLCVFVEFAFQHVAEEMWPHSYWILEQKNKLAALKNMKAQRLDSLLSGFL